MKKKFVISLLILFYVISFTIISSAINLTVEDIKVKPGDEFTVTFKFDEGVVLSNSHISYNKDLFSFIGTDQINLTANEIQPGEIAWMYTDLNTNTEGTKNIEFKFKANDNVEKKEDSIFKISDITIVTPEQEYSEKEIKGNKEFKVTISNKSNNPTIIVVLILLIAGALIIFGKIQK